jgi:hypothetical protein
VTVSESGFSCVAVDAAKLESPEYDAVIESLPPGSPETVSLAAPLVSAAGVPTGFPLTSKVTVPVGVPAPGDAAVTVAPSATGAPYTEVAEFAVTAVVTAACPTFWSTCWELLAELAEKSVSPL